MHEELVLIKEEVEVAPDLVSKINSSHDARLVIFERISGILNDEYVKRYREHNASGVWNATDAIPHVSNEYDINISSLQFENSIGLGINIGYSIAVNLGEVRIGIIVPDMLAEKGRSVLELVDAYPSEFKEPARIIRSLSTNGYLLDYIFTTRFGSLEVTKAALESRDKDSIAINTLSDAVARELIHINHSLMHALSNSGFLVLRDSILPKEKYASVDFATKSQPSDIIKKLNIVNSQLYIRSRHEYTVFTPQEDLSRLEKLTAALTDKFMRESIKVRHLSEAHE